MKYSLFLFDLDDTLLDFQASEKLCFKETCLHFGLGEMLEELHRTYKFENNILWAKLEKGEVDKDFLKIERFRKTLQHHNLDISPEDMSHFYLEELPKQVVLIDGAVEILEHAKKFGEIGIITNGMEATQKARIKNSALKNYIDFVAVSEECGYAKPDTRFFQFAAAKAKSFSKQTTILIGDRFDADIVGATQFEIDSCWFNPHRIKKTSSVNPTYEVQTLLKIKDILA